MDKISYITDDDIVKDKYTKHPDEMTDPLSIEEFYETFIAKEETSSPNIKLKLWNNYYNWAKKEFGKDSK